MAAFFFAQIGEVFGTWFNSTGVWWCSIVALFMNSVGLLFNWYFVLDPWYDIPNAKEWVGDEQRAAMDQTVAKARNAFIMWLNCGVYLTIAILVGIMLGRQTDGFVSHDPQMKPILYEVEIAHVSVFSLVIITIIGWAMPGEPLMRSYMDNYILIRGEGRDARPSQSASLAHPQNDMTIPLQSQFGGPSGNFKIGM